jgi:hypothetical protein
MLKHESKAELIEAFKQLPEKQQAKIIHIRNWTQKFPKGFTLKHYPKLERNCFVCDSSEMLQPHHITYTPKEDWITVCNRCHSFIHEKHIRYKDTPEDKATRIEIHRRITNPTIEEIRERFKFTNRCGKGKCKSCNLNCRLRRDYIKVIKHDMTVKRGCVI